MTNLPDLDTRLEQAERALSLRHDRFKPDLLPPGVLCEKCAVLISCRWEEKRPQRDDCLDYLKTFLPFGSHSPDNLVIGYSFRSIHSAAKSGCHLCYWFLSDIDDREEFWTADLESQDVNGQDAGMFELRMRDGHRLSVDVSQCADPLLEKDLKRWEIALSIHGIARLALEKASDQSSRRPYIDLAQTLRKSCIEKINLLAAKCTNSHHSCAAKLESAQGNWSRLEPDQLEGPRRMIKIETNGTNLGIRLEQADHWPKGLRYNVLSHCWGTKGCAMKLLQSRVAEDTISIDMLSLPRSFFDAVLMTWAIGLKHIWIDALCIIQDSNEDWSREGIKMSSIYSGCYIGLFATGASDSEGGLFCQISNRLANPVQVKTHWPGTNIDATDQAWQIRNPRTSDYFASSMIPLMQRAWVYQERLLVPRAVIFAGDSIRYKCLESCYSESTDDGRFHWKMRIDGVDWRDLVPYYTFLELTNPRDKLVALAGVAKAFARSKKHPHLDADYLAGLWRPALYDHLIWFRWKPCKPVKIYRAPSWSWAAGDGSIHWEGRFMSDNWTPLGSIIEAKTEANGYFGEVKSGYITICAHLYPLSIKFDDYRWDAWSGHEDTDVTVAGHSYSVLSQFSSTKSYFGADDSEVQHNLTDGIVYVPLYQCWLRGTASLIGLVMSLERPEAGVYRRRGLLRLFRDETVSASEPDEHDNYKLIRKAFPWLDQSLYLDLEFYQNREEQGKCRFTIV